MRMTSFITGVALLAISSPAKSQDWYQENSRATEVGLYFRLNFGPGASSSVKQKMQFGGTLSLRAQAYEIRSDVPRHQILDLPLFDVAFSRNGFEGFSVLTHNANGSEKSQPGLQHSKLEWKKLALLAIGSGVIIWGITSLSDQCDDPRVPKGVDCSVGNAITE